MLRPSRPMMRPFMSSAGSWTTETVVSAAWPAARRCMTTARMLRTRRSASRLVSSSIWRTSRAESWRIWSSSSLSRICLAWEAESPLTRSSSRTWRSCASRVSCSRSSSFSARASSSVARVSRASSRAVRRSSRRPISCRRASALSVSAFPAASLALTAARGAVAGPRRRRRARGPASPAAAPRSPDRPPRRPPRSRFPLSVSSLRTPPCRARRDPMLRFQDAADRIRPGPGARDQHEGGRAAAASDGG